MGNYFGFCLGFLVECNGGFVLLVVMLNYGIYYLVSGIIMEIFSGVLYWGDRRIVSEKL